MDERKSYKRVIFAYSGAGVVVVVLALLIARNASNNPLIGHVASTPTPAVMGVYSGIRPDATPAPVSAPAAPAPSDAPSETPSPSASVSPSPKPAANIAARPQHPQHPQHVAAAKKHHLVVADADATGSDDGHIVPIEHPAPDRPTVAAPEATAAPVQAPPSTPAPAPAATQAPVVSNDDGPIFAPNRVVDAQVKNAVQPDYSNADRNIGAHGTSIVLVTIDPKGNVVSAAIGTSSGYATLDRAAINAARASSFVAPKINGHPATETYRMVYDFSQ